MKETGKRLVGGRGSLWRQYAAATAVFTVLVLAVIFLFALTPLPDDLLFLPLGLVRFSLWKALLPAFLGKTVMSYIIAYSGSLYIELFPEAGGSLPVMVITTAALFVIIILIWRTDWDRVLSRILPDKDQQA